MVLGKPQLAKSQPQVEGILPQLVEQKPEQEEESPQLEVGRSLLLEGKAHLSHLLEVIQTLQQLEEGTGRQGTLQKQKIS